MPEMPVALVFVVEFVDGQKAKLAVACTLSESLYSVIVRLNRKLEGALCIPAACPACGLDQDILDVRLPSGAPVRDLSATIEACGVGGPSGAKSVVLISPFPAPQNLSDVLAKAKPTLPSPEPAYKQANVKVLGPKNADVAKAPSDSDDGEPDQQVVHAMKVKDAREASEALHLLEMDGAVRKVFAKFGTAMSAVVCYERPLLCVAYPMQLVECVRNNAILRTRTYDPNCVTMPSSISGVQDADYAKYLSVALTHGRTVYTTTKFDKKMAFHVSCLAIPHSCAPSCSFTFNARHEPYTGVLRCARAAGLEKGDEITVLAESVNRPEFFLLPVDRRHKLLQARYHFTCRCDRCMKSGTGPSKSDLLAKTSLSPADVQQLSTADLQSTLSGAFWGDHVDSPSKRNALATEMRDAFAALGIVSGDENCSVLVDNATLRKVDPASLLGFINKYSGSVETTPLVLHRHHWRLCLCRMAYLRRVAGSAAASAGTICKRELAKDTFTTAVHQLAVEAIFIPAGHPHILPTYRAFRRLVAALPATLAASVQRDAAAEVAVDWTVLRALDNNFPLRGRKPIASPKTATEAQKDDHSSSDE
jgi:hypothetical protein